MFGFGKKKEVVKQEGVWAIVPEDRIREILVAWDCFISSDKNSAGTLQRYNFWKLAEEVCPELQEGSWAPIMRYGTSPRFKKNL